MRRYVYVTHSSIQSSPDKRCGIRVRARLVRSGHTLIDVQKAQYDEDVLDEIKDLKSSLPTRCTCLAHPFSSLPLGTNYCSLGPPETTARTPDPPCLPHPTRESSQATHPRPYIIHQRPIQPIQERRNAPFHVVVPPTSIHRLRI